MGPADKMKISDAFSGCKCRVHFKIRQTLMLLLLFDKCREAGIREKIPQITNKKQIRQPLMGEQIINLFR